MKSGRPFLLWLLCLIFLALAAYYLVLTIRLIQSWNILLAIQYSPAPIYSLFMGGFLGLCFLAATVLLWMRLPWASIFDSVTVVLASLWYWLNRLVFTSSSQPLSGELFQIIFFLILFALVLASLWALQPYLGENPKQKTDQENLGQPPLEG